MANIVILGLGILFALFAYLNWRNPELGTGFVRMQFIMAIVGKENLKKFKRYVGVPIMAIISLLLILFGIFA